MAAVAAPRVAAMSALCVVFLMDVAHLTPQRRVNDREPLFASLEGDVGDSEHAAQFVAGDLQRPGGLPKRG